MTATCIPPYASPPLHDSEPWNNTGNQLRPLQLQECKTLSDAPSADPHCPVNAQGLAPPAVHWHSPWPTPVTSLHCSLHSWADSASPRRACQTATTFGCRSSPVFYHWPIPHSSIASPSRCAPAQFHTDPHHKPPMKGECTGGK